MNGAYYNDNDPYCAQWLRNLIAAGLIAPGDVDERSIKDVKPDDLRGYTQAHFFAGIGGWSYALRLAGWDDDRECWTGSCPCQPLSVAGQRFGHADQRHLWPAFHGLIAERRPAVVFCEQVASKDGREWFAAVRADLEGDGYACGAADLCAAGVGAPHIRQRLWFVGHTDQPRRQARDTFPLRNGTRSEQSPEPSLRLADTNGGDASTEGLQRSGQHGQRTQDGGAGSMADDEGNRWREGNALSSGGDEGTGSQGSGIGLADNGGSSFWSDLDWLLCTDGKARPTFARILFVSDGVSHRLDACRPETEEEITDGTTEDRRTAEALRSVWGRDEPEDLRKGIGGSECVPTAKILRSEVHGAGHGGHHQGAVCAEQPQTVGENAGSTLRGVRQDRDAPVRTPHGREPVEQQPHQHSDIVRLVSSSVALAELLKDTDAQALQALLIPGAAGGPVLEAFDAIQKIRRSAANEIEDRFLMGIEAGVIVVAPTSPLARGIVNRASMLRALGNSVVPQVAAEFIGAYMELRP